MSKKRWFNGNDPYTLAVKALENTKYVMYAFKLVESVSSEGTHFYFESEDGDYENRERLTLDQINKLLEVEKKMEAAIEKIVSETEL